MWIKFCGIVRPEDLAYAVELGVDAVGVIAVPGTPRCVSVAEANTLARMPRAHAMLTLILQDPDPTYAEEMIAATQPDLLQFHGQESRDVALCHNLPYVKAIREFDVRSMWSLRQHPKAFAWLLDMPTNSQGSSRVFESVRQEHAARQVILAGNLKAETVGQLATEFRPWGVDVSRGIERTPREKDHNLMKEFVHAVRDAEI